jgi:ABC-type polysaccharide/polyol phosphate export permease
MRSAFLGSSPMPWDLIGISALSSFVLLIAGVVYFSRSERHFADVI